MDENTLITCPAPLEMMRRGSPIQLMPGPFECEDRYGYCHPAPVGPALVTAAGRDGVNVVCREETSHGGDLVGVDPESCHMDLTDATGRAHAAWWVGQQRGVPLHDVQCSGWVATGLIGASLRIGRMFGHWFRLDDRKEGSAFEAVPALAHLDPNDNTRLPDGSRVVDALALKAVVEHLIAERGADG